MEAVQASLEHPLLEQYPSEGYSIEVIKNGVIVEKIDLCTRPLTVFGRAPDCHAPMAHPSISRYHAIIQWLCQDGIVGLYVCDLDSTHGTFLNKQRLSAKSYQPLKNGFRLKFGSSTRHLVVHAPDKDERPDFINSDLTHQQMRAIYARLQNISQKVKRRRVESDQQIMNVAGSSDDEQQCSGYTDLQQAYQSDPKGELQKFFNKAGKDMRFNCEQNVNEKFNCTITLPVCDEFCRPIIVEVEQDGKKKEVIRACALEACKILDEMGLLDPEVPVMPVVSRQERLAQNDFYSSDEDTFFDRTGELEQKRKQRAQRYMTGSSNQYQEVVHTFQSLTDSIRKCVLEERDLRIKLQKAKAAEQAANSNDLDEYIKSLQNGALDSRQRSEIRFRLTRISHEKANYAKLVKISASCPEEYEKWKKELAELEAECELALQNSELAQNPPKAEITKVSAPEPCNTEEKVSTLPADVSTNILPLVDTDSNPSSRQRERSPPSPKLRMRWQPETVAEPVSSRKKVPKHPIEDEESEEQAEKFVEWQPPKDQTGDGRTKLNEKFGY